MLTIDDYMDTAKKRLDVKSNRQLAIALGLNQSYLSHWATRRAWPSDEAMVKLAETAGLDPLQALIDLNLWRQQSPQVRDLYSSLSKMVSDARRGAAIIAAGALLSLALPQETKAEQITITEPTTAYYGKYGGLLSG